MGFAERIRGWIEMLLGGLIREELKIKPIVSPDMDETIRLCRAVYEGEPDWLSEDVKTVNFAKTVCSETARLAMIGTSIQITGSKRAEWLQEQVDKIYHNIREWVEFGCAYGTVALKPDGEQIEVVTPDRFFVTDIRNKKIIGAVFVYEEQSEDGKTYFTRLEWQRFQGENYVITNKCYASSGKNGRAKPIKIDDTPWAGMMENAVLENVKNPLFAIFKTPQANSVDLASPLGLPIFYEALEELKDLDVAYSRNAQEIFDSERIVLVDSDRMIPTGGVKLDETMKNFELARDRMGLPKMVKNVYGDGMNTFYQEINPNLNTDTRLSGINALLGQIGFKIGFSNGHFVFNKSGGIMTATQVEADQQRTIQFVKDIRDQLEPCLRDLLYALEKFADIYAYAPVGETECTFDFGDITYNREEDRARWYGYVVSGKIPFWYYLVKFEGFTEEEAKLMSEEAANKTAAFFEEE